MSRFYFAWVDPTETTFGPEHHVTDERIYTFTMDHTEGNCAQLMLDIKNPRIGLLNPGRKIWAWFSYDDGNSHVTPIIFGRLVGIPTNILAEVCTLTFIGKAIDHVNRKQAVAESMKVRPYYDPVWIAADLIDDADTILEAYSALWHIDRVTHEVSASDIIVGEDGDEDFTADESFYDNVSMTLQQTPLVAIEVNGIVNWTQIANGTLDFSSGSFSDESAFNLISSWPKPGTSFGGGWSVAPGSFSTDTLGILGTQIITQTEHFQNKLTPPSNGDAMTIDTTLTQPVFPPGVEFTKVVLTDTSVGGFVDPDADPPINISSSANVTYSYVPKFIVDTALLLSYAANRPRTERVTFTLQADVQAILALPEELDHPIWAAGVLTNIGDQVINNQNLYVASGFISAVDSPDPSQGVTGINAPRHLSGTVSDGTPGFLFENNGIIEQFSGGPGVLWTFVSADSASDQEQLTIQGRNVDLVMPGESIFELPSGGVWPPGSFFGNPTPDGSPIGDPSRRSYFPTDRGQISIQYLIAVARAHLLLRSRAVQVKFDCQFERGLSLSCRKNGRLFDHRLPGGVALGKIVAYQLSGDGDAGKLNCTVTIGCAVGLGNAITEIPGDPEYVTDGWVTDGYQVRDHAVEVLGSGDVGYTRPLDQTVDDGLLFPLLNAGEVTISRTKTPSTLHLVLAPVVNGPFGADYYLTTTKLTIPQQINLQADSL